MPPPRGQKRAAEEGHKLGSGEPHYFAGTVLTFWATHHMQHMQQRVQQLGGVLQPALAAGTTHVVCSADMTAQHAAAKLQGCTG